MGSDDIQVLIADDQSIIREGLQILLAAEEGIAVIGVADNGKSAIQAISLLEPDVALIDIEMPHMDGLETAKVLCQEHPSVKILILSSHDDSSYLLDALQAGASGYLLKSTAASDVAKTIRAVHRGNLVFGPGVSAPLVAKLLEGEQQTSSMQADMLEVVRADFDSDRLRSSAHHFAHLPQAGQLWKVLTDEVYGSKTNLSGAYMAGWFAYMHDKNTSLAMHYFASGFDRGIKTGATRAHLEAFYQAGKALQPETAFGWLLRSDSPWQQNQTERTALFAEAEGIFGASSSTYRWLLIRSRIEAMGRLNERLAHAAEKLDTLHRGFESMAQRPVSEREKPAVLVAR